MISRVLTPPGASDLAMAGLPPGAPDASPLNVVFVQGNTVGVGSTSPLITADGAPVYSTGPGSWGQLRAAGRV